MTLLAGLLVSAGGCEAQDSDALDEAGLAVMIDSLLPSISEVSGLAVREPVRFGLQSREEARAFIAGQLDDEVGARDLAGMERIYEGLGLLPDTIDLRGLLLELMTEQVVGYYDPAADRLYVVEGVEASTAAPVVAHELVHALQDQHADLEALIAPERGNDRAMAAQAAAEGQAMIVMLALQAAETTGQPIDPGALPDLAPLMRPMLEAENSEFPVFQRAPRLVRETLIFPYIGGAGFVQALYRARTGTEPPVPFGDRLPESTEQVMDPERAFLGERDAPTDVELSSPPAGWTEVYGNGLGQLELSILLDTRFGEGGGSVAEGWDGDRVVLLEGPDDEEALVWVIVWDDEQAANRFVAEYRRWSGPPSPGGGFGSRAVQRLSIDGRPAVRVVESRGIAADAVPVPDAVVAPGPVRHLP